MFKEIYSFPATFEFGEEGRNGECSVYFHDLPGMTSAGDDFEDAEKNARDGLAMHLELMIERGESIPEPSPIDNVPKESDTDFVKVVSVTMEDIRKVFIDFYSPPINQSETSIEVPLPEAGKIQTARELGIPFAALLDFRGISYQFERACIEHASK